MSVAQLDASFSDSMLPPTAPYLEILFTLLAGALGAADEGGGRGLPLDPVLELCVLMYLSDDASTESSIIASCDPLCLASFGPNASYLSA